MIEKWKKDEFDKVARLAAQKQVTVHLKALSVEDLRIPFFVLTLGFGICFLVFLLEVFINFLYRKP